MVLAPGEALALADECRNRGFQLLVRLATGADQDNAGHAFALHALDVPTGADSFLFVRQPVIAEPASSLAGGADRVQRGMHVQHDAIGCFSNDAHGHLRISWAIGDR